MMKTEALLGKWTVPVDRPVEENTRSFLMKLASISFFFHEGLVFTAAVVPRL